MAVSVSVAASSSLLTGVTYQRPGVRPAPLIDSDSLPLAPTPDETAAARAGAAAIVGEDAGTGAGARYRSMFCPLVVCTSSRLAPAGTSMKIRSWAAPGARRSAMARPELSGTGALTGLMRSTRTGKLPVVVPALTTST